MITTPLYHSTTISQHHYITAPQSIAQYHKVSHSITVSKQNAVLFFRNLSVKPLSLQIVSIYHGHIISQTRAPQSHKVTYLWNHLTSFHCHFRMNQTVQKYFCCKFTDTSEFRFTVQLQQRYFCAKIYLLQMYWQLCHEFLSNTVHTK